MLGEAEVLVFLRTWQCCYAQYNCDRPCQEYDAACMPERFVHLVILEFQNNKESGS